MSKIVKWTAIARNEGEYEIDDETMEVWEELKDEYDSFEDFVADTIREEFHLFDSTIMLKVGPFDVTTHEGSDL